MYSTKTAITMCLKDILEKLSDADIYSYYLGKYQIGKLMNSPLRHDDSIPSFAIYKARQGNLMFKDHGTGDTGNALKFIKLYKGIQTREELERELLRIVRHTEPSKTIVSNNCSKPIDSYVSNIGIVRQPFTDVDKKYWKQFHISLDTLKKYQVFSIKYFLCNRVVKGTYKENNPMYAYKVDDKFKIYRPLASKYTKWRTNLTNLNVQGLSEIPQEGGDVLIITKSLKDVMVLHEMGVDAIAGSSETTFIPDNVLKSLRRKYKHILILYDRDKIGVHNSRKLSKEYKLDAFLINKKFKAKDISDAVKDNGFDTIKSWLFKIIDRYD